MEGTAVISQSITKCPCVDALHIGLVQGRRDIQSETDGLGICPRRGSPPGNHSPVEELMDEEATRGFDVGGDKGRPACGHDGGRPVGEYKQSREQVLSRVSLSHLQVPQPRIRRQKNHSLKRRLFLVTQSGREHNR
jgi:hypothetical protein